MNGKNIGTWILQGLLAAVFLFAGTMKLAGSAQAVQNFHHFGYGDGFRIFIGACEVVGGLALLIPHITTLASLGLMFVMIGAAYSHLAASDGWGAATPAVVLFVLLGIVAYARSHVLASFVSGIRGHAQNSLGTRPGQATVPFAEALRGDGHERRSGKSKTAGT
jgi:uncharacterized membrane protein YphA (DoxX/SURF4 family)